MGESTFRPNPLGSESAGKPRGSKTPGPYDRPEKFEAPVGGPSWWERIIFGRISSGQLSQFCRQFSAYLNAGVDITRALSSLEKQNSGTALGPILSRVLVSIRRGSTLEEAMAREPQAFGPMFLNMIKVAEARGGVPETLKMLAQHFESRQRLIRQARLAMIYPAIVMIMASGVVALITVVLLPMFASLLADISKKSVLPLPSRILMGFSQFVQSGGWWIIPVGVDRHAVRSVSDLQDGIRQGDHGSTRSDGPGLRPTLPQDRHHPVRPDPFGFAQCGSRHRPVDRLDRRRA